MKRLFLIVLFFSAAGVYAQQKYYPQVLVELYSSEGCDNCPFADQFVKEILNIADSFRQPVYVIDFHVTIWNRSGWVDPYSDSLYSQRQFLEAQKVGQQAIFTPMMFINGEGGLPGAAKKDVGFYINTAMKEKRAHHLSTSAQLIEGKKTLSIDYAIEGNIDSLEIHFALVKRKVSQLVTAGDNKGKTLVHHNVVREFGTEPAKSKSGHYELPLPDPHIDLKEYGLVSFLQRKNGGYVFAVDELLFR